jgi:small subunit ribosomal protein S1
VHEGTILKVEEKSAIIALPYGVEGYAPIKQLYMEDKKTAKEDEVLQFRVTEFNKENKRIVLSHTAVWKGDVEEKKVDERKAKSDEKDKASKAAKKNNESNEKSTFADVEGLAALKASFDKN